MHCPNLRKLELTVSSFATPTHRYALSVFLKRHAAQLTALTLHKGSISELVQWAGVDLQLLQFPHLEEFCTRNDDFSANNLTRLNVHMPSIRTLFVRNSVPHAQFTDTHAPKSGHLCDDVGSLCVSANDRNEYFVRNTRVQYLCIRNASSAQFDFCALGAHLTALDCLGYTATELSALQHLTNLRSLSLLQLPCSSTVDFASLPHSLRRLCIGVSRWSTVVDVLVGQLAEHCAASRLTEVELSWHPLGGVVRTTLDEFVRRVARDGVLQRLGLSGRAVCDAFRGKFPWMELYLVSSFMWEHRFDMPITWR